MDLYVKIYHKTSKKSQWMEFIFYSRELLQNNLQPEVLMPLPSQYVEDKGSWIWSSRPTLAEWGHIWLIY